MRRGLPADSREASVWLDWGTGVPSFFQCQPTAGTRVHQCQPVSSLRLALQCPVSALRAGPQLLSPVPVALSASWVLSGRLRYSSHSRKDAALRLTHCASLNSPPHVFARGRAYSMLAILSCHTQLSRCSPSHSQRYSHPCPSSSVPPPVAGRRLPCRLHLQHSVGRSPPRLLSVCALSHHRPLPLPSQLRPLWSHQLLRQPLVFAMFRRVVSEAVDSYVMLC